MRHHWKHSSQAQR